ncbi:MAG: hypothetical protein F6K37_22785 [Moorea sp. SIO4E2]|nr:hypothetical protein [Moorena sp. SIO4E2]NEQ08670.1 hypothetical protein [Moorena sp. SIO4E2]
MIEKTPQRLKALSKGSKGELRSQPVETPTRKKVRQDGVRFRVYEK